MNRTAPEHTVTIGQQCDVFPDGDIHGEVQDVPQNRITLRAWRIRQGGSPPLSSKNEDKKAKQQQIEHRGVNHGGKERVQGYRTLFLRSWKEYPEI